jgi:hypothetical protein
MRGLLVTLVGMAIYLGGASAWGAEPAADCSPAAVRAAVSQACACSGFSTHGLYRKCVGKEVGALRAGGCDSAQTATVVRCAAASICSEPKGPVVCCHGRGHAKIMSAARCTAHGGTVLTGVTTLCDANCPKPGEP